MILEVAVLDVRPGEGENFRRDFAAAQKIIASMPGYIEHDTGGFRESPQYLEWKKLLHHYYDPFPVVQHYESVVF